MNRPLLPATAASSTPCLPPRSRTRRRCLRLVVLLAAVAPGVALACTSQENAGSTIHLTIDAWEDPIPDKLVASWKGGGSSVFLNGCAYGALVPFEVTSAIAGLDFVRNVVIDGERYPAFGLRAYPRSPLLIFRHLGGDLQGGDILMPLDIRHTVTTRTAPFTGARRTSYVWMAAVSRGGDMQEVPTTSLGTISRVAPAFPRFTKTDTFSVSATLKVPTCSVTNTAVALDEVHIADLPSAGASTGEKDFNVSMRCNGTFPVELELTDANAPGSTGSRLAPTANATADGVRVELLKEGIPMALGVPWTIPQAQNGGQNILLTARYYREAGAYSGGVVEGQAILTATYR